MRATIFSITTTGATAAKAVVAHMPARTSARGLRVMTWLMASPQLILQLRTNLRGVALATRMFIQFDARAVTDKL